MVDPMPQYWPNIWPGEDGGPARRQIPFRGREVAVNDSFTVVYRSLGMGTMVVWRNDDEMYLLCHTGDGAVSWVEQLDQDTLATTRRSVDLAGGPMWPGGIAAHANGFLYVVFGNHAHKLTAGLDLVASRTLPRERPYNSFVILPDGCLATKDFGGSRPGEDLAWPGVDTEVVVLDADHLDIVGCAVVPEASIARLSADSSDIYVVGVDSLRRLVWDPTMHKLALDEGFSARYREEGEGYGWDPVLVDGDAWFLNNGQGSERFAGTLQGIGVATVGESLVRVAVDSGAVSKYPVCELAGGVVANPPAIDPTRGIAVGYDSGNAVVTAWEYRSSPPRKLWSRSLAHGAHPLVFPEQGLVMLNDFGGLVENDQIVFVHTVTGTERLRVETQSPVQSVLFGAMGPQNAVVLCSFLGMSLIRFAT